MPAKKTIHKARQAKKEGKAPSTQASEFVKEEMHKLEHKKGAPKSRKQAVAIGLSEARRHGVKVPKKSKKAA